MGRREGVERCTNFACFLSDILRYEINKIVFQIGIKKHKRPLWIPWKHLLIITYCGAFSKKNISTCASGVIREKLSMLSYTNLWHLSKLPAHILDIFQCKRVDSDQPGKKEKPKIPHMTEGQLVAYSRQKSHHWEETSLLPHWELPRKNPLLLQV